MTYHYQPQPPQQQTSGHKAIGVVLLLISMVMGVFGVCGLAFLGVGIIPIVIAIPLGIVGLVLLVI